MMNEAEMHHEDSDHEQHDADYGAEDLDFDDALLWGRDEHVEDDDTDEDDPHNDMDSDIEEPQRDRHAAVEQQNVAHAIDDRHLRAWNLRGQLGGLCASTFCTMHCASAGAQKLLHNT
jgi:hypothetical protein